MHEAGDGSETVDPGTGGEGLSEGGSRSDEERGGRTSDGPVPQGGGAQGGPADPIAGTAGDDPEDA